MDTRSGEIFRYAEPMNREKRRRMEEAADAGYLVDVSERVATLMEGALELERDEKRKAAKQARKKNR